MIIAKVISHLLRVPGAGVAADKAPGSQLGRVSVVMRRKVSRGGPGVCRLLLNTEMENFCKALHFNCDVKTYIL